MKINETKEKIKRKLASLSPNVIWVAIAIMFLLAIQVLFTIPAPNKWLDAVWEADGFIVFIGTVVLGFVAVSQNIQANKLNANMQKLEEARFISMISLRDFKTNYRDGKCTNQNTVDYKNSETIDFVDISDSAKNLEVYSEFYNSSEFPIVGISSNVGKSEYFAQKFLGVKPVIDKPVYISEKGGKKFTFLIPFNHVTQIIGSSGESEIVITLFFENIFGYRTKATLVMYIGKKEITYSYRMAKFVDVKPAAAEGSKKKEK